MSNDSMRGLFFIIKGQYSHKSLPEYTNRVTGSVGYIGGFNPEGDNTKEWYMLMDRRSYQCIACGSDFDRVLKGVKTAILTYKGQAKKYFKHLSSTTSDDYYEVHYLGHRELSPEKRAKKAEGKCPRTSPAMRCLYEEIDKWYGDYYEDEIEEMEEEAYSELVDEKPVNKSRKILQKAKKALVSTQDNGSTPRKVVLNSTPKKVIKEDKTPTIIRPVKRSVKLRRV